MYIQTKKDKRQGKGLPQLYYLIVEDVKMTEYYTENNEQCIDEDFGQCLLRNILITVNLFLGGLLAFGALM